MSLDDIEKSILAAAEAASSKVRAEVKQQLQQLQQRHVQQKTELESEIRQQAKSQAEKVRRSYLIPGRLQAKKELLTEKQKLIGQLYTEIQKEHGLAPAEVKQLRERSEVAIAQMLFD